jgi:hypothetical protein
MDKDYAGHYNYNEVVVLPKARAGNHFKYLKAITTKF